MVRYVLVGLGVVTVALAVVLAWEQQWWAAIPDGAFGIGVAWVAWVSVHEEHSEPGSSAEIEPLPKVVSAELEPPRPGPEPLPPPRPISPPEYPMPRAKPKPKSSRRRRRPHN